MERVKKFLSRLHDKGYVFFGEENKSEGKIYFNSKENVTVKVFFILKDCVFQSSLSPETYSIPFCQNNNYSGEIERLIP